MTASVTNGEGPAPVRGSALGGRDRRGAPTVAGAGELDEPLSFGG